MLVALEIPTAHLKKLSSLTDFDFVIASQCLQDSKYANYYKSSSRFMMLDNGMFELGHPISDEELIQVCKELRPNEVIVPDDSLIHTIRFVSQYNYFLEKLKIKTVGVLHGQTLEECRQNLQVLLVLPVQTICIPLDLEFKEFQTSNKILTWSLSRLSLLSLIHSLKLYQYKKDFHLLGVSDPGEVLLAKKFSWVRSIDTSCPIVSALRDIALDQVEEKLVRPEHYFDLMLTKPQVARCQKSIKLFKFWCS